MKLNGKTVWITGASSGIGAACAEVLSQKGCKLILSARKANKLEEVKASLAHPDNVIIQTLDLSQSEDFPNLAKKVWDEAGGVDLLINNGGISQRSLTRETDLEIDRRLMEVNYFGNIALTKALLPHMLKKGRGQFAVVTSLTGKLGFKMRSGYAASKHALHGFYESLRLEEAANGIEVSLICPGFIKTELSKTAVTGDGSPQGTMDDNQAGGMLPEVLAQKMIRAIEKGKHEAVIGGFERHSVWLKRFFPKVLYRMALKKSAQ